ncbi:MAG: histone deacetylase family protein, partial [Chloroflexota bacterium]
MQVVYSPAHLGHDLTVETYMGVTVPANEVAARAEVIRAALAADGGFPEVGPSQHGIAPIIAVHDPGLVLFLEVAWSELRAQRIDRPFLTADTYPNRSMFEGMSDEAIASFVRDPVQAGGRAGFWGLDSAAPIVAGTYDAARAAVDVALTATDLVLGGAVAAYGLCRPPGHHAARSMYGGYCYFNNAAIAAEAIVA